VSISGFVDIIVVSTLSDDYPITAPVIQTAFGGGIRPARLKGSRFAPIGEWLTELAAKAV
jgi:hypothetical protein